MATFDDIYERYNWRPIRDCPGRYVLRDASKELTVEQVMGVEVSVREFRVDGTPDVVLVAKFPGGGLISFRKPTGVIVHTLNTPDGLARRLARFGIELDGGEEDYWQLPGTAVGK